MNNAYFTRALVTLLQREGLYSNDPKDRGGETAFGISKVKNPKAWKNGRPTLEDAKVFYWDEFWFPLRAGNFFSEVGAELFDSGVNAGRSRASKWLQKAYNLTRPEKWKPLKVDGKIGPKTQSAVNRLCGRRSWREALVVAMNGYQFMHYAKQNDHHHIRGWLSKRVGGYGT